MKLSRLAKALAGDVNIKRKARGLLPRPVRYLCFHVIFRSSVMLFSPWAICHLVSPQIILPYCNQP